MLFKSLLTLAAIASIIGCQKPINFPKIVIDESAKRFDYNYNYDDKINSAKAFALDFISSYREIVKREVNTIRA